MNQEKSLTFKHVRRKEGQSVGDMLHELRDTYRYELADTNDPVFVWVEIVDEDWNRLFYGGHSFRVEKTETGWVTPRSALDVKLGMASHIWIPTPQASWGRLIVRHENGNVADFVNLDVWDGGTYFPEAYAGKYGQVFLYGNDNDGNSISAAYTLTGSRIINEPILALFSSQIENHVEFDDSSYPAGSIMPVWIVDPRVSSESYKPQAPPTIRVKTNGPRRIQVYQCEVRNDITKVLLEVSKQGYIRAAGEIEKTGFSITEEGRAVEIDLSEAGEYFITFDGLQSFEWKLEQLVDNDDDGGRG